LSLGCWPYPHPNRGRSSILTQVEKSDPIFRMDVDVMRPVLNLEPKYRVTLLTREERTEENANPPRMVYRLIQDG
jgi:hypothetical protein